MASIIPNISVNAGLILTYMMWAFIVLIATSGLSASVILYLIKKKATKFVELNLSTKKVQIFDGKYKKAKSGLRNLWARRIKKFLPNIQQEDIYTNKGKDFVILFKDNNGMHHTARLPTHDELKKWYKTIYDIDIDETVKSENKEGKEVTHFKYNKVREKFETIYLLPNPSEDLNWLGTQCTEADQEYVDAWWKHPTTMLIATVAICGFIFIISLIITAKMT